MLQRLRVLSAAGVSAPGREGWTISHVENDGRSVSRMFADEATTMMILG
jgi:hypothetical protein